MKRGRQVSELVYDNPGRLAVLEGCPAERIDKPLQKRSVTLSELDLSSFLRHRKFHLATMTVNTMMTMYISCTFLR